MSKRMLPVVVALLGGAAVAASETDGGFAFSGPEVFPLDLGIAFLHVADLDGDGLKDLVVVNNLRSKINLLYNRTGDTNAPATPLKVGRRDLNELPGDARFRVESIASEKRITSLTAADLNGDGRTDIAYFGEPKELIVQFNLGTNGWSQPRRYPLDDGAPDYNALTSGDINADGRADLLLLAEKHLYLLRQEPDGGLGEPERLPYTGVVKAVQVLDLNGDGRKDLLFVNWDHANPFRFRLQQADGQFGPEIHLPLTSIRSYWADDLDDDGRTEVITIAAKSGRAALAHFALRAADPLVGALVDGQFSVLPLTRTDKPRRGVVWADVSGDGLPDLVAGDPGGGQLTLWLQRPDGSLTAPRNFPSLSGVSDLVAADWDGDGKPELFLLSADERQVGITALDASGRFPFPQLIPLTGRPMAIAVGTLKSGEAPRLAVLQERDEKRPGKDGKEESATVRELVLRSAEGDVLTRRIAEEYKGSPAVLAFHDANQDGLNDLVALSPYEKVKVFVQRAAPVDGDRFQEVDVTPPGGSLEAPWMITADVDGDGRAELLLPQRNFLRAVVLVADSPGNPSWTFSVRDQINGATSSSRIAGAAAVPQPGGEAPLLFLLDSDRKALTVARRDPGGVWRSVRNTSLPVTEFTRLVPLALGGRETNSVGFIGSNAVAWKQFSGEVWDMAELDSYETPIRDGWLHDVTSGDLDSDGRKDLVFLETARHYVDLVRFEAPNRLEPGNRWPVFEERTFRQRRNEVPEPREAVVADVTGDGRNDLILVVHDRVLVYPQE
ncbi:MAG: VCBS repeat-containing protein [Verrucomicrobiae bacterium]|nr:VCBS repeat-containing protein [Verrucomicrobiae bacterium]